MPRGIYDRTKTKEQREADKAGKTGKKSSKAAPQKRKYTRRTPVEHQPKSASNKYTGGPDVFSLLNEVRMNLQVLNSLGDKFESSTLSNEVEVHVALVGQLREKIFTAEKQIQEEEVAQETTDSDDVDVEVVHSAHSVAPSTQVPLPPPVPMMVPPPHI